MRRNNILIIYVIFFTLITFYACNKDSCTTMNDTRNYEISNVGQKHNDGLISIYNIIEQSQETKLTRNTKRDSCILALTKQTINSFLQEEFYNELEKLQISLDCSESEINAIIEKYNGTNTQSNVWFTKDTSKLTDKEIELLSYINDILDRENLILDDVLNEFEIIRERVTLECTDNEALIMNCALSIGIASSTYWSNNFDSWCTLLTEEHRGWFNWGDVVKDDIAGAVGGAISGAAAGALAGGAAAIPGAGVGALSGGLSSSGYGAVIQIFNHYFD